MINRNNYEVYLIDYMDGKLDAVQVSELLLFLEQNPDIKETFEGLNTVHIAEEEPVSFNKEFLKKPPFAEVKHDYYPLLVGAIENTISKEEKQQLDTAKRIYPQLVKEEELFRLTLVTPDLSVTYPLKKELRKPVPLLTDFSMIIRLAAAILLLAGGWWFFRTAPVLVADGNKPAQPNKAVISGGQIAQTPVEGNTPNVKESAKTPVLSLPEKQNIRTAPNTAPATTILPESNRILLSQTFIESKNNPLKPVTKFLQDELVLIPVAATLAYQTPGFTPKEPAFTEIPEVIYAGVQARKQEVLTEENKPGNNQIKPGDAGWAALSVINRVTGADIKVVRKYDQAGKKRGIEIAANNFHYSSK